MVLSSYKFLNYKFIKKSFIGYKKQLYDVRLNNLNFNCYELILKDCFFYFSSNAFKGFLVLSCLESISFSNSNLILYENSSLFFLSSKLFEIVFSFTTIVKGSRRRFHPFRKSPYYNDYFCLVLNTSLNIFFPWYNASLLAISYNMQFNSLKSKRLQIWWIRNINRLLSYFCRLRFNVKFFNFKYFSMNSLRIGIKGRSVNLGFCSNQRYKYLITKPLMTNYTLNGYNFYSWDSHQFTTRWGSNSVLINVGICSNY